MKRILLLAGAALTLASAQAQAQQALAFVTCPMLRDTATVPCWLAEYNGELFYLATQDDPAAAVSPPSLGHQALIEGTPTAERRCGGRVLTGLHVSVRPDRDPSCDVIIPATEAFQVPAPAQGPRAGSATAAPRPAALPAAPGSLTRRFDVLYDFDWQTAGRETALIQEAAAYAQANPVGQVRIKAYRAAVALAGGRVLEEAEGIDLRRGRELSAALAALGVKGDILVVDNPVPELGDHTRRHAFIEIVFGGSDDHSEH